MSVSHISFNQSNQHGSMIRGALTNLERGLESINDVIGVMSMMIDGDGSQAIHFAYVTTQFGFPDDATSKAAFDELNSLASKLNSNVSVTNVNAALLQAFNKFR